MSTTASSPSWESRVRAKQESILSQLPKEYLHSHLSHSTTDTTPVLDIPISLLSASELEITSLDVLPLIESIASGKYTSIQVLKAFTHRAAIAHQLLNCCLEFPYASALARAAKLDEYFKSSGGKTIGPLHGLPISVKDQCRVVGTETTCGFVANLGKKDTRDSLLVEILQDAGAVVFVKTSLSMGCMWGETINNIIGTTSNPFNRSFSCGGSSGGEGALIGFHGSPLGIGSDLGGSIRSPSAYQGLWGLRPSSGRIPYHNILNSMEGQETIPSVVGPMSHSPSALTLFTKIVVISQPWLTDPKCQPIPWRDEIFQSVTSSRKLKIGIMEWDGNILPQPPIRWAMKKLETKLRAAGHEIISWRIDQKAALSILLRVFSSDASGDIDRSRALSGEPPQQVITNSTPSVSPLTILESWDLACEKLAFQSAVLEQWRETSKTGSLADTMDVYITPVNPAVAPKHGHYARGRYLGYTGTVNVLDFSACTIPIGFVDPELHPADSGDTEDAEGKKIPGITGELDGYIRSIYDPEVYKGLPITVQIVGRRMEEEKVLGIATVLEGLLKR
ncbi:acetamidase [Mollisia scopiformis]|uniref:amidase n=1 Tax=Mollisia scopiformis TaxID=149040 RepID=A0A132BDR2_MOLSC|nr:acetamidase [Mollisia scopiformis]KUJ10518.1 acetamidase [Mollisia scopiformis]